MTDNRTPNEIGEDLEETVRTILQGERVPGSGSGKWWKLDVRDGFRIVWSCKGQKRDKTAFRITKELLLEIRRAVSGMRGTGDQVRGGFVFEIEGEPIMAMPLQDFADVITAVASGEAPLLSQSKAQARLRSTRRRL